MFEIEPASGFVSLKVAARETGYSKQYLYRLCRQKKVEAIKIGSRGKWFVSLVHLRMRQAQMKNTWDGTTRRYILKIHPKYERRVRNMLEAFIYTDRSFEYELYKETEGAPDA